MAQIRSGDAHGLYRVQVGFVSEEGFSYGQVNPAGTVANGTTMPSYLLKYAQGAEMALPDRTVIDFTGGDVWTGSFVYGITSLGQSSLTLSNIDSNFIAMASDSYVDQTTNTRWTVYSENIMLSTPPQMWMITTFRIQSKDTGTKGANKFINMVFPRIWISPKGLSGAPNFQAAGTYSFNMTPTVGDRFPHGVPFTQDAQHWSENENPLFFIISDNPLYLVGHVAASGASATINLPFRPVGSAATYLTPDSDTQPVQVVQDGVITDASDVDPVNATVTVTDTFAGGEYIGILYETTYQLP